MNSAIRHNLKRAIAGIALFCTAAQPTLAAVITPNPIQLASEPLFLGAAVIPKVMLTISKDQQLFKKAYNDYSDLDGDGQIETTYKHSVQYYGYFDPRKCYDYRHGVGAVARFEPATINSVAPAALGLCPGRWHGNFLNWVSMTRMDAVRKLLYGGMRSTDGFNMALGTVLERAYVPTDAHAWAKYYNPGPGSAEQPPIDQLTPFAGIPTTPITTVQAIPTVTLGAFTGPVTISPALATVPGRDPIFNFLLAPTGFLVGDQIRLAIGTGSVTGAVKAISGNQVTLSVNTASIFGAGTSAAWRITNLSSTGISFCNMTPVGTAAEDLQSQTNTQAPLIRVARGNHALWSANERYQCLWSEERRGLLGGFFTQPGSNGNHAVLSGIDASSENPSQATQSLSTIPAVRGDYVARVQVCASAALIGGEKCRNYGGVLKPFGLLQEYGDDNRIHFGLTTGSFTSNTNGGVLRKNVASFNDEVNAANGTFRNPNHYRPPNGPRTTASPSTVAGIVNTLNYMRIYGYYYGAGYPGGSAGGTYRFATGDNCDFQLIDITPGSCTSWGNPMAEVFFDSLRYFANQPPVYTVPAASKDNVLGLPQAVRTDPMANTLYCAKMNVLVFNASVSTNEDDLRNVSVSSIHGVAGAAPTIGGLTNRVGTAEGITAAAARRFFVGRTASSVPGSADFELCTPKVVAALGDVAGICPEGPTLVGSYFIGGLAYQARTTPIRPNSGFNPPVPAGDTTSLTVTSYGIQLATNTPELVIPVPGAAGRRVVIQPLYRLDKGGLFGGGALVDMKFVSQTSDPVTGIATGKVYVNWEDSEYGGDNDQDMWGTISWRLDRNANTMTVTTHAIASSTGAFGQGFGFSISGTTQDGPHFFSGLIGFNFNDPSTPPVIAQPANFAGCSNCRADSEPGAGQRGAQTATFTLSPRPAAESLKDPLWYLAKYGGFTDKNGNDLPDDAAEWDTRNTSGTVVAGGDGIPDNYFLVTNPLGLEEALRAAFEGIGRNATATSVAANTTSLQTNSAIYSAQFDPRDWSGDLEARPIRSNGTIGPVDWSAQEKLKAMVPARRNIYTFDDTPTERRGTEFRWPGAGPSGAGAGTIPSGGTLFNNLNTSPDTGLADGRGQLRLDYLRGDRTNEATAIGFRKRSDKGPLGDIINSNPVFVPEPRANIFDIEYQKFKTNNKNRRHVVYVAANDGMLHGFDAGDATTAGTGNELLAYVPSKTFTKLNQLTSPSYANRHRLFVDGSPDVSDACMATVTATPCPLASWKTVLVGTHGAGAQGVYALDVTDPASFGTVNPVMWEFTDADDPDLGFVTSQPVIRRMANGRWAAIVSGGYNNTDSDGAASTTGNAVLFVIFLSGPTGANRTWRENVDYIKIDTNVGFAASPTRTPNGLARPLAADTDANGMINFVYAGDLTGRLWKFDLSHINPLVWRISSRRVVLFTATGPGGVRQPITAAAEGALHPGGKGFIINFGTGKYLEPDDTDPARFQVQTYYGIWDKNDTNPPGGAISTQTRLSGRSQLLEQVATDDGNIRKIALDPVTKGPKVPVWSSLSDGPPNADDSPSQGRHMGWYMDFPGSATSGERAVFTPILRSGRLIYTTLIPSVDPCLFGGSSFLMVVNSATGGPFTSPTLDTSGDGVVDAIDNIGTPGDPIYASGMKSGIGITNTPRLVTRPGAPAAGGTGSILGTADPRVSGGFGATYAITRGSSGEYGNRLIAIPERSPRVTWREGQKD